jgi:hypothetical protein
MPCEVLADAQILIVAVSAPPATGIQMLLFDDTSKISVSVARIGV